MCNIQHEKLFTQNVTNVTFSSETFPNTNPMRKKWGGHGILCLPRLRKWRDTSPVSPTKLRPWCNNKCTPTIIERYHQRSMLSTLWKTSWATKKSSKCLTFALQKKISKRNCNQISIRLSFQIKQAHSYIFVRNINFSFLLRLVARVSQQGAPKTTSGQHFLNTVLDICSNRGAKHEMGVQILNGGLFLFQIFCTWTLQLKKFLDCDWTWTEFSKIRTGFGSQNMTVRSYLLVRTRLYR